MVAPPPALMGLLGVFVPVPVPDEVVTVAAACERKVLTRNMRSLKKHESKEEKDTPAHTDRERDRDR